MRRTLLGWRPVVSVILALSNQVLMHWLIVGPHSHSYQMVFTRELQMRYIVFIIYILINMCISNIRVNFNSSIGELMPVDLALKAILGSIATNPGKHAGV